MASNPACIKEIKIVNNLGLLKIDQLTEDQLIYSDDCKRESKDQLFENYFD